MLRLWNSEAVVASQFLEKRLLRVIRFDFTPERRSVQTYHDWCTCAPVCHLMPQLLAVKQGHVYEGGNRSRRWEENLKSLSLTLSLFLFLSRRLVSLHPAQSTRITLYVNTHTQRERETRAAKKAPAHARYACASFTFFFPHTNFRTFDSRENFPAFPREGKNLW